MMNEGGAMRRSESDPVGAVDGLLGLAGLGWTDLTGWDARLAALCVCVCVGLERLGGPGARGERAVLRPIFAGRAQRARSGPACLPACVARKRPPQPQPQLEPQPSAQFRQTGGEQAGKAEPSEASSHDGRRRRHLLSLCHRYQSTTTILLHRTSSARRTHTYTRKSNDSADAHPPPCCPPLA